nr:hypothetical protein [uncultured Fluviicola sp.]
MIVEAVEYHPDRIQFFLKTMRDFSVNQQALDLFINNLDPKVLVSHFNSFESHQKDYTILIVWELLKSAGNITEKDFCTGMHALETIVGIEPSHIEGLIDKMEVITKQVNDTPRNVNITYNQVEVRSNNSESGLKGILGFIILALAIFGLVSMCKS